MTTTLRVLVWLLVLGIAFSTLSPLGLRPTISNSPDTERFLAYLLLSGIAAIAYARHPIRCLLAIIVLASLLEGLQLLDPGRHGKLHDAVIKIGGALCGALIGFVLRRLWQAFRH